MNRRVRQWLGFLLMLAGLGLLCGPFLLGTREEWVQKQAVETFYQEKQAAQSASQDKQPVTEETVPESTEPRDLFYEKAKAYNESLVKNGQDGMRSRADVESFALSALDFGYSENLIGTLEIPRMEIELGLYLGADGENMAKGAAVFGMTSLPLGGDSENTAIAGHRGWRGSPMFRDIQLLQMDDPIYITTPWDTLTYRVCEIRIVTPEDNSWCRIQPGRTLISLMTCHPYGQNYQRYIVFAELSPEDKPSEEAIRAENAASYDPSPRQITQIHADGTSDTVTVDPAAIRPDGSEYGAVLSNFVILAEDKMRIAAWIGAAVVALSGIWLTVQTLRDFKKGEKHHESE